VLLYFSIFVEESYSVPSKLNNNQVYRIATGLWLLTAVVLTNPYISHVISELNAPLKGTKLKTLERLFPNISYGNSSKSLIGEFYNDFEEFKDARQACPVLSKSSGEIVN